MVSGQFRGGTIGAAFRAWSEGALVRCRVPLRFIGRDHDRVVLGPATPDPRLKVVIQGWQLSANPQRPEEPKGTWNTIVDRSARPVQHDGRWMRQLCPEALGPGKPGASVHQSRHELLGMHFLEEFLAGGAEAWSAG